MGFHSVVWPAMGHTAPLNSGSVDPPVPDRLGRLSDTLVWEHLLEYEIPFRGDCQSLEGAVKPSQSRR